MQVNFIIINLVQVISVANSGGMCIVYYQTGGGNIWSNALYILSSTCSYKLYLVSGTVPGFQAVGGITCYLVSSVHCFKQLEALSIIWYQTYNFFKQLEALSVIWYQTYIASNS